MTAKPACLELLPCPFCGGESFLDDGSDAPNQIVQCSNCDAAVGAHNGVEQWNRRASPPSSEAGKDGGYIEKDYAWWFFLISLIFYISWVYIL